MDNLSRKLLAYALNRSLQLSDESLMDRMETQLTAKITASIRWSRPLSQALNF